MVLAGMEMTKYTQHEIKVAPGACLFLYTDGVTEATGEVKPKDCIAGKEV